jgi:hypothetical protein
LIVSTVFDASGTSAEIPASAFNNGSPGGTMQILT